jgi:hypothetical protein
MTTVADVEAEFDRFVAALIPAANQAIGAARPALAGDVAGIRQSLRRRSTNAPLHSSTERECRR